jgi:Spy/CpxP family protein refolding chaperone
VLAGTYVHSRMASRAPAPLAIERARHVGLSSLKATLNLTPSQEQVITKILDDYGKYYQNIEDEREDVAEDGRRRILEVLTPEQRARFNAMIGKVR